MRRDKFDLMAEILEIAKIGAKQTWIVYQTNLNFKIVKGYLKFLMEKGLIEYDGLMYHRTTKGQEFLNEYKQMTKLL